MRLTLILTVCLTQVDNKNMRVTAMLKDPPVNRLVGTKKSWLMSAAFFSQTTSTKATVVLSDEENSNSEPTITPDEESSNPEDDE